MLVQNFLENANFQYYPIFPEQLRGQSADWWEARAAGQRLSPELTCLLIRVCAVSAQYLEDSLRQRLELEIGEKAQSLTERFHAAAQKLSSSIPRGHGGIMQVQQLFLEASWWKSEASMVEAWHALSAAIREAQEIGMSYLLCGQRNQRCDSEGCQSASDTDSQLGLHKPVEGLPNFERELRARLWCILWTWDWLVAKRPAVPSVANEARQMSTLLSRPLLIDQSDHRLEIPDGRLENISDPEVPHPLSSVALQAQLGLHVSHLFQKMGTDRSVKLVLDIEEALEMWMGTFPAAMRDHRPDTRWDQKYPNVPFMRCQVNVIAYCYLLAPLKPYLLGNADPEIMNTQLGADLRMKGVETCLDLMKASEKFYDLIFPQNVKYFFIIFFMFDAATVMASAIVHDTEYTLPKRNQCIRSLRTAQELMDGVADVSEAARVSAQLLRKLTAKLPLTEAEKQILGVGQIAPSKKIKTSSPPGAFGAGVAAGADYGFGYAQGLHEPSSLSSDRTSSVPSSIVGSTPYVMPHAQPQQQPPSYAAATQGYSSMPMPPAMGANWQMVDYGAGLGTSVMPMTTGVVDAGLSGGVTGLQPGDPLTGTYLDSLWDWNRLNMDLTTNSGPQPPFGP